MEERRVTMLLLIASLSLLILVHEAGHFLMARWLGIRVERFSIGFGPVLLRRRLGETEYVVSLLPLGGYVKMAGEQSDERTGACWEYGSRSVWQRASVIVGGPLVNYLLGLALFIGVFWSGYPVLTPRVGAVLDGYPAAAAGVQPGDQIVALDGAPVDSWEMVTDRVRRATSGASLRLSIEREGVAQTIVVTPRVQTGRSVLGKATPVAVVGLTPAGDVRITRYAFPSAVWHGVQRTVWLTSMTYQALWQMLVGALPVQDSLTGPVGIFYLTSSAAALGIRYVVQLMAIVSVSLAIFNLLPIPVLDGGHLAFLVWERVRRRPVSLRLQERMTRAGFCLLLGVMVVATYHDLIKFQVIQRIASVFQ